VRVPSRMSRSIKLEEHTWITRMQVGQFVDVLQTLFINSQGEQPAFREVPVPADYAVMLRWLTETIISGNGSRPNDDVEKVTGSPPITLQDFARRSAHAWTLEAVR
jgi:hypothetical protein